MNIRKRLAEWWRHNHSFRWVDTGDEWSEYETQWQTEHAALIQVYRVKVQVHPETGETRKDRLNIVGMCEPISRFDEMGYFDNGGGTPIPPAPDTDPVINEANEFDGPVIEVTLGEDNE